MKKDFNKKTEKEKILEESSVLGIVFIDIALILVGLILAMESYKYISAAFLFLGFLGFLGRLVTAISAKKLSAKIELDKSALFPDDEVKVTYTIKNEKSLPVTFVEIEKKIKFPVIIGPRDAIEKSKNLTGSTEGETGEKQNFIDRFFDFTFKNDEDDEYDYLERCSRIGGFQCLSFKSDWKANRRGIEKLRDMYFKTGDGFGITKATIKKESSSLKEIVVYPKVQPVDISFFTQNKWEGEISNKGVLDDPTLIKFTRPYEDGDSEKRINWRMLARNQGMMTNTFEVISPKRVHFILDGQSFLGKDNHENEFEDALSIITSISLRLSDLGMYIGISLPKSKDWDAVDIFPEEKSVGQVLYRLAGYQLLERKIESSGNNQEVRIIIPKSIFNMGEISERYYEAGRKYFVTYGEDPDSMCEQQKTFEDMGVRVLTYKDLKNMKEARHE